MCLGAGHSPFKYRFATGGTLVAKVVQTIVLTCVDCAGSKSPNYRLRAGHKRLTPFAHVLAGGTLGVEELNHRIDICGASLLVVSG